jgi:hypothetical protein
MELVIYSKYSKRLQNFCLQNSRYYTVKDCFITSIGFWHIILLLEVFHVLFFFKFFIFFHVAESLLLQHLCTASLQFIGYEILLMIELKI